ncbi:hypothetical protein SCHPADRAFT_840122, partial [Schizopora paradoxa]
MVRRFEVLRQKGWLVDIFDGDYIHSILDTQGLPFMTGNPDELRLAWALSVDWYNPYHNKTAGKTASVGSVAATCLNLPPSLRHRPEYVFLASLIPGPREP